MDSDTAAVVIDLRVRCSRNELGDSIESDHFQFEAQPGINDEWNVSIESAVLVEYRAKGCGQFNIRHVLDRPGRPVVDFAVCVPGW